MKTTLLKYDELPRASCFNLLVYKKYRVCLIYTKPNLDEVIYSKVNYRKYSRLKVVCNGKSPMHIIA